jgi:hypothetical protein
MCTAGKLIRSTSKKGEQIMVHGNGANGTATHDVPQRAATATIAAGNGHPVGRMSSERLQEIRASLTEPFEPSEIKWRVTATSANQGKKRGQLVAYADQRAYTDRLNAVFGEWDWTRSYDVQVAQNFERRAPGDKTRTAVAAKLVVVCTVTVCGLGSHAGVGEEWADDQNAATRAEAQAFKRACACFGLGRYLYDVDTVWVDLDQYNRPVQIPNLPDWALPRRAARAKQGQPGQGLTKEAVLAKTGDLRQKIGRGLSQFVLKKYATGAEPESLDQATLTTVLQKFTDIGKGIDRLRRGAATLGDERYAVICRELNLASESVDAIPDRDALQRLLARVEAGGVGKKGGIADARGRLLQAARKLAEKTGKRLADIIAEASDGKLSLDGLRDLTDADVPFVSAATSRMT